MAVTPAEIEHIDTEASRLATFVTWNTGTLGSGDTGEPVEVYSWSTVVVSPVSAANFAWEGSNDGVYFNIPLTPEADGRVETRPRYMRPANNSGSGVNGVTLFASRQ